MTSEQLIQDVISKTNSELILFFVLVLISLIVFFVPFYRMMLKDRKERFTQENARQDKLIAVITANTEIITSLKTIMEMNINETNSAFARIDHRTEEQHKVCREHSLILSKVQGFVEEAIRNQDRISGDIKRAQVSSHNLE